MTPICQRLGTQLEVGVVVGGGGGGGGVERGEAGERDFRSLHLHEGGTCSPCYLCDVLTGAARIRRLGALDTSGPGQ